MKTSEFIKYFEDKGCEAMFDVCCDKDILFKLKNQGTLFYVSEADEIDTNYPVFNLLDSSKKQEYYKVIFEYLLTPIEEREEKKEYYLKLKHFNSLHNYLNLNIISGEYELSTIESSQQFKTKFTKKEIDDIPKGIKSHNWEYVEVI